MAKQLKNKGPQPAWSRKPLSEDQKRSMDVATKKFNKNFKPASGKVEFTADKLAQDYIKSGGPVVGFGTKSSSTIDLKKGPKNPGQSTPDAGESKFGYANRAKKPLKADKDFVRKSKTKPSPMPKPRKSTRK
jgi:hypothetical protein